MLYTTSSDEIYKIEFHNVKLHSRRITMHPDILSDHESRFKSGQLATFPFSKTDIKYINIPTGSVDAMAENIYRIKLPNSALVFFVESAALTGNTKKNPQNFQNFNISKMVCRINSEEVPAGGYQQNYAKDDFAVSYRRFFDNIGIRTNNMGNNITPEHFKDGSNIYAFDMTPDACNGFHDHINMSGKVEFEVQFKEATTTSISMVILSQYDDKLTLDDARNVVNRGEPVALNA